MSKEFWHTVAGGAGSISLTALLGVIIYWGKKYLSKRNSFDIFSRNVLQTKEDFELIRKKIADRVKNADRIINDCQYLQTQSDEVLSAFINMLAKINVPNQPDEALGSIIKSFQEEIRTKYPHFQNSIHNFFINSNPGGSENKMIPMDLEKLKVELNRVVPIGTNAILQYFDFKIPVLKEIDNERLGFLNAKHRKVLEVYNYIIKESHVVENNYNLILKDVSDIKMQRNFILNVAIVHINLANSIMSLIQKVQNLIEENNLVREDLRLPTLPENTFKKTNIFLRPVHWIFRWFA